MLKLTFYAAAVFCAAMQAHASLTQRALTHPSMLSLAQLQCTKPGGATAVSLGALLQSPVDGPEVVLATAHGLGGDAARCVVAYRGQRLTISYLQRGRGAGTQADWAVLRLAGRFDNTAPRLLWQVLGADELRGFFRRRTQVHLLKFANGETGRACRVRQPPADLSDESDRSLVMTGDCITFPGMSGAPVLASLNNRPVLVGVHIGQRFSLNPAAEVPLSANLMRLLGPQIERAIQQALAPPARQP